MNEPLLWSWDQIGNDEEILIYFAGFCAATNSDKLSDLHIVGKVGSVMKLRCMAHRDILRGNRVWLSGFYRMSRVDSISRNHPYTIACLPRIDTTSGGSYARQGTVSATSQARSSG